MAWPWYSKGMVLKKYVLSIAASAAFATTSLLAAGCFSPTYQEGLACSESGECPGELSCVAGTCQLGGGGGGETADAAPTEHYDAAPGDPDAAICPAGSQTFDFTGTIENFALPECATSLHVEALGAQGGGGRNATGGGGRGARIVGDFVVEGGELLAVLVGGQGLDAVPGPSLLLEQGGGTGGGGSFLIDPTGAPLLIAGGGGGATHTGIINPQNGTVTSEVLIPGGPGQITESGQAGGGSQPGSGGTSGGGGGIGPNTGFHSGTGAGGFTGGGIGSSTGNQSNFGTPNAPGASFQAGGAGGIGGSLGRGGGFGGGGSAGFTGGGGGGYSGGGGGDNDGPHGGGGGGSFNSGTNPDNQEGVQSGNGQIVISYE